MENQLESTLEQLGDSLSRADAQSPQVSQWSVGMHVQHCCLGMTRVAGLLSESQSPRPPRKWSFPRTFVMTTGFIPRGRGRAPESICPKGDLSAQDLQILCEKARQAMRSAAGLDKGRWFLHPVFGALSLGETLKFLAIHNRHHLKIIRNICKTAQGRGQDVP